MKIKSLAGLLLALAVVAGCNRRPDAHSPSSRGPRTFSSFDTSSGTNAPLGPHMIRFQEADLDQVLALYQELSGRSLIRSPRVPAAIKITFDNATALTRVETLQALDNLLAVNGIVMVYLGQKYVKVISAAEAASEPGPVVELPPDQLPDSSSFLTYIVTLKRLRVEEAVPIVQPFAKLPNSIIGTKGSEVLILRDYSSNVRRMLEVLEKVEASATSPSPMQRVFQAFGETNSRTRNTNRR